MSRSRRDAFGSTGVLGILGLLGALDPLARFYRTDKASGYHAYTRYYAHHLASRRLRPNLVFEIGTGGFGSAHLGGESLRMWRDYLPRSRIVGIDIEEKHCAHLGHRVELVRADQSDPGQLAAIVERFGTPDIVIDDGSHIGDHVVTSFTTLFPLLNDGGIYVVEDLHTSYLPAFGGSDPPGPRTGVGLAQTLVGATQSLDVSFPAYFKVPAPIATFAGVGAVHAYPGIVFVEKVASDPVHRRVRRPRGQWRRSSGGST